MKLDDSRLLSFAETLQSATDVADLLRIAISEVRETIGYQTAWIAIFDMQDRTVRMLAVESPNVDVWTHASVFPFDDDPYMERIAAATGPQIVRDAQVDPGVNRAIVEALGNRTIVNIPMRLMDQPFGALGMGTFGDEGVMIPTDEQLSYLEAMANQLVVASARIVLLRQREEAAAEAARIQKLLEQRQRLASLGQLAGGVAHDFNNLLTVIAASASYLRRSEADQERRDELELILEASERAAELTRRLLTLGQRQPLRLDVVTPDSLLTSMVEMMRRVIPADISIELTTTDEVPQLLADRAQLEQVITNLCLNARDAMPDGGNLSLTCDIATLDPGALPGTAVEPDAQYVEIGVHDTGAGIPPHILERIFEPFFTTKGPNQGTGLGLAVCRGIVEQHGGFIRVESAADKGTSFRIYLAIPDAIVAPTLLPSPEAPTGGHERVLVADDQPHVRRAIEKMLQTDGYIVTAVGDGQAAIDAAEAEPFDLIILDAIMPKLGGRQAYDEIRRLRPEARFLFASGYGAEEMTARFLTDTSVPIVQKPFSIEALLRMVRAVLDGPAQH